MLHSENVIKKIKKFFKIFNEKNHYWKIARITTVQRTPIYHALLTFYHICFTIYFFSTYIYNIFEQFNIKTLWLFSLKFFSDYFLRVRIPISIVQLSLLSVGQILIQPQCSSQMYGIFITFSKLNIDILFNWIYHIYSYLTFGSTITYLKLFSFSNLWSNVGIRIIFGYISILF